MRVLLLLCALVAALAAPSARAATPLELYEQIAAAAERTSLALTAGTDALFDADPGNDGGAVDAAVAAAEAELALVESPDALAAFGPKPVARYLKALRPVLADLRKARDLLDAEKAKKASKSVKKATTALAKARRQLLKLGDPLLRDGPAGAVLVLQELNAKTAGFHKPGKVVRFRAHGVIGGDGSVCEDAVASSSDPSIAEVTASTLVTNGLFTVTMKDQRGLARIRVTACGRTSEWLVYCNVPATPPVDVTTFDGTYVFDVEGEHTLTYPGGSSSGPVADDTSFSFSVAGGAVTVTYPSATGGGTVLPDGTISIDFSTQAGVDWHFRGKLKRLFGRVVQGTGTYTTDYAHPEGFWTGSGAGSWSGFNEL